jgi:tetraacyldisaccharide 4'-kinase
MYEHGVLRTCHIEVPVLVVGNISVGGTGKTPLVLYLVEALKKRGYQAGIVSRGYGGSGQLQHVSAQSQAVEVGDEPLLLARRSGSPVCVARDRVAAARSLLARGVQCIISDDGLQHYRMARQAQVAVLDGQRGLGNGACLPAGPLREPGSRLAQMDLVVVNGGRLAGFPDALTMNLVPGDAQPVAGNGQSRPLESFSGQTVHALAGIGNPARFFDVLRSRNIKVLPHPRPDHAALTASDLEFQDQHQILMTEKDAVKCSGFAGPNAWYVPVTAMFDDSDSARLDQLLDEFCIHIPGGN